MKKPSAPKVSKATQSKLALAPKFATESKAHHAAKAEFGATYESAVTFVAVVHKGKLTGEWQYLANPSAVPASAGDKPLPKASKEVSVASFKLPKLPLAKAPPVPKAPLARLKHHVTGAVERGEAEPVAGVPAVAPGAPIIRKSTISNPVKFVWDLCDEKFPCARRDVVDVAIAAGVATNTARTQWAWWNAARRQSAAAKPVVLS